MKSIKILVLAAIGFFAQQALPSDNINKPVNRLININGATIPGGFDNSEPIAIVSGIFPNSCYAWDRSEVKHVDEVTHEVRSYANVRPGMCLMVLIPFGEEISLGTFKKGLHTIRFLNGDDTFMEKTLEVE